MVRHTRFELVTTRLKVVCSTNWANDANGVTDGDRTRDNQCHKLALYQLNYGHHYNISFWSGKRGSNSRHSAWKADALPTELLPQFLYNMSFNKWGEQDSNLWRWKPADLQSALVGRLSISPKNQQINMINIEPVEGFEPTTPRLQITCSGQLSYTGIFCSFSNKNYSLFNEVQIYDIFLFYQQKNVFFWKISY